MDSDAQHLATAIGARVRGERTARGWTLDRLAEVAGISRRMIVNVEQGAVNPSIGTLLRLSDALGIGLPSLVAPLEGNRPKLTRAGSGVVLWSSPSGGRAVLVAGTEPPDVVELWEWLLAPGDAHESEAHASGTRELLQVIEGRLAVTLADESFVLDAGDALTFAGDEAHAYANPGTTTTRFSMTVYEPGVGAGRRGESSHV
ncbi:helix-turn-helix transcriptional regulator [Leucobacter weissii]|uniref:Helix-turn-helix transcriptional regulator n=1 Tax=Leucobacter weissii TaxID=1983706 RepID=A0A939MMW7_9MICO|nr:XRE family transcriptional regulator [Leucobacter weissii]MBO1901386.1 helix-turn-helix transcriptional regulator [Leucobacter weissii]